MAFSALVDLVKVTSTTSGQGALTLGPAVPGYLTPSTVIPAMTSGSVVSYGVSDPSGGNEVGQGILTLTGSVWTLTRGVTQSSNGGAPILCTGQATVALTLRAEDVTIGMTRISGGSITSPVSFLDISLPDGFARFQLLLTGFYVSANDAIAFGVSTDGGVSFINDTANLDSYAILPIGLRQNSTGALGAPYVDGTISLWENQDPASKVGTSGLLDIFPGSASQLASLFGRTSNQDVGPQLQTIFSSHAIVNPAAVKAPTPARINLLRFIAYGITENLKPPDSGETLTAGSYVLWGLN